MHGFLTVAERWLIWLGFLAGIGAFAYEYSGWFAAWMFVLTLCVPLLSLLLALPSVFCISVTADVPGHVGKGESAYLTVKAEGNRFLLPLPMYVIVHEDDLSDAFPWKRCMKEKLLAGKKGGAQVQIGIDSGSAGLIRTTLLHIYVTDPIGFFRFRAKYRGNKVFETLILPEKGSSDPLPDPWEKKNVRLAPTHGTAETHEIRSYRPGDEMRSVHWKLSAKTDEVLVREGYEPVRKHIAVTFDRVPDKERMDAVYREFDGLLRGLLTDTGTGMITAAWRCADGTVEKKPVRRETDLFSVYLSLFAKRAPKEAFTGKDIIGDAALRDADRGYHITADAGLSFWEQKTGKKKVFEEPLAESEGL